MVAVPPMMRARLLMRRQSAHGRSDTHPHSTRATVLAIPGTEKQQYIKYCNHSPYDCSGSSGRFFLMIRITIIILNTVTIHHMIVLEVGEGFF